MKTIETISTRKEAQYRVLIKRILRTGEQPVQDNEQTSALELQLRAFTKLVPEFTAAKLDATFERAAQAAQCWIDGNNSGNGQTMEAKEKECDDLRDSAVAVLKKCFGIETDFPGLYPSFTVNGKSDHTTLAAIKSALKG